MSNHEKQGLELEIPAFFKIANRVGRAGQRIFGPPGNYAADDLMGMAASESRLDDFGDLVFKQGLQVFLDSAYSEGQLSPVGRAIMKMDIVTHLKNRLEIIDYRKREPAVAENEVKKPLFIVGLPRTGTTVLYELMALDEENRSPLSWELLAASPPPTTEDHLNCPRIRKAERYMQLWNFLAPQLKVMHEVGARLPQECITILASSFQSELWGETYWVPGYRKWLLQQDQGPAFGWHKIMLQHLQHNYMKSRWLLKAPAHVGFLDGILNEYPDAMVVHTHRDPMEVMASFVTLLYVVRQLSSDSLQPVDVGIKELEFWAEMLERAIDARARINKPAQFADVYFQDVLQNPIAVVEKIYDQFGLELSVESRARMADHLQRKPRHVHGKIEYSLEQFGLSVAEHSQRFERYYETYNLARS